MSQIVVHVVGAQKTNYPWGFENKLMDVLAAMGVEVISTDFRQERKTLPEQLRQSADMLLVCKGEWIAPQWIGRAHCPSVLWYAEFVGSLNDKADYATLKNRHILAYNGPAFDYAFSHDQSSLGVYTELGCRRVGWLPTAAVYPKIHKKLDTPKDLDVLFIGTMTPRREEALATLSQHFTVHTPKVWDPIQLNEWFNRAKIVLNIHASEVLNTETRLCEVLGAGSFLLSETISSPDMFKDGQHLVCWQPGHRDELLDKIHYYLTHEEERESIAQAGHTYALENHTLQKHVEALLLTVLPERWRSDAPPTLSPITIVTEMSKNNISRKQPRKIRPVGDSIRTALLKSRAWLWALSDRLKVKAQVMGLQKPRWLKRPLWLR